MPRARAPLAAAVCLLGAGLAEAKYARVDTDQVPIARLVSNLEKRRQAEPKDPGLLVNLARLHAMAFATKAESAQVRRGTEDLWTGYGGGPRIAWRVAPPGDGQRRDAAESHLQEAIRLYREAVDVSPKHDVARLGLGWCLLQSGDKAGAAQVLRSVALETFQRDSGTGGMRGVPSVSEEATGYLLQALDPRKDEKEVARLEERRQTFAKLPRAVTPLLLPLRAGAALPGLLAPLARVRFDVDGRGRPGAWSWISEQAGWLVLLPRDGTREIRSGLQLVGSVSFWLFWRDGYEALSALDGDGDGILRGHELEGLGVWQDRNGDGRCDPGEVRTLAEVGVVALDCASEEGADPDVIRWSPRGVVFRGGETRPTWDVLLHYAPPHETLARGGRPPERS